MVLSWDADVILAAVYPSYDISIMEYSLSRPFSLVSKQTSICGKFLCVLVNVLLRKSLQKMYYRLGEFVL